MRLLRPLAGVIGIAAVCLLSQPLAAQTPPRPPDPSPTPAPTAPASPLPLPSPFPSGTPGPTPTSTGASPLSNGLLNAVLRGTGLATSAPPQAYDQFIRGAERQAGLIDILRKDEDTYLDLTPDQLDHPYIVAPTIAAGVGNGTFAGKVYEPLLVTFKRVGKRVLWVSPNTHFTAEPGTPAEASLSVSVADSVIASSPIVAEDKEQKRVVIAPSLFLTDFENVGAELGRGSTPSLPSLFGLTLRPSFTLDASRSYYVRTKAFPKNDELLVNLTFAGAPGALTTVPDARGVPVKMHYSIMEPPKDDGYIPRFADDRVGYFITAQKNFADDTKRTPFIRYINRWNLAHGPITYYLTKEIPTAYRPTIRRALLTWSDAFARIGIPNAIEVKDQPDDPSWDPDDARYTTVRWITSDRSSFAAYGPAIADPRSGQILRADIVIDGEVLRSIRRGYVEAVQPVRREFAAAAADEPACQSYDCDYAADSAEVAATAALALRMDGRMASAQTEEYVRNWLYQVVLHEAGHNLGLRHNFAGSSVYSLAQLRDRRFTASHGLVGSVMDYTPVNLSPSREPQGDLFQTRLGPYDYWAIEYGYRPVPGAKTASDELPALRRIADRSTQAEFAYGTDEDARGAFTLDPKIAAFDLSSDPLAFDGDQFRIVDDLVSRLDRIYPRDDRSFYDERQAFMTIMRNYERSAALAVRYVGGVYTSRAHRGQPGATAPFVAIPRNDQRRAFELLAEHVLSSHAFAFSPELLNNLGPDRFHHWNSSGTPRPDFPLTDLVGTLQDGVIFEMYSPATLTRIADQARINRPGATMSLADLFGWTRAAVWDDLAKGNHRSIAPLHRELQRRYTDLMLKIALLPTAAIDQLGMPYETQSLARYELRQLDRQLVTALGSRALDVPTRAHLEDVYARVHHGLQAFTVRPL